MPIIYSLVYSRRMTIHYLPDCRNVFRSGYNNYIGLHWTMHNAGYEMRVTYYRGQADMKARA